MPDTNEVSKLYNRLIVSMKERGLYDTFSIVDARTYLDNQFRQHHINYEQLCHLFRVSIIIAKIGFSSDVIVASLLHEVNFSDKTVAEEMPDQFPAPAVHSIIQAYQELSSHFHSKTVSTESIQLKTQDESHKKALYIKLADRIDVLRNSHILSPQEHSQLIENTKNILLNAARMEGAHYLLDSLENECFKADSPIIYYAIQEAYLSLLKKNRKGINEIRNIFGKSFNSKNLFSNEIIITPLRYKTISYKFKARKLISIYREISRAGFKDINDIDNYITKKKISLFDITLVFSDEDNKMALDSFIEFYKAVLRIQKIRLLDYRYVSDNSDIYFLIEDSSYNKYRLFLKSKNSYLQDTYGFGATANIHFRQEKMFQQETSKLLIYDRSNHTHLIEKGASVLDFAFYLHTDIGLCAKAAYINGSKHEVPLSTKLNDGDSVIILSDSHEKKIHAQIDWFEYLYTKKATKDLIAFFKNIIGT